MNQTFKEFIAKVDTLKFITVTSMLAAFILCISTLLFRKIPLENKDAIMILIGMITGSIKTMIDYHYGSSKSSSKKNELIDKALTSEIKKNEDENNN
jgi:hypothetical protein